MINNVKTILSSLCVEVQEDLSATFDGEDRWLAQSVIDQHLKSCDDCSGYQKSLKALEISLKNELSPSCDSDQLWVRILESIESNDAVDTTLDDDKKSKKATSKWIVNFALAASVIVGVLVTNNFIESTGNGNTPLVIETVSDFEIFQIRGELLDVNTTDMSNVVQWMSAKVDFEIPDSAIEPPIGFSIHGGRLCSLLNRRSAFFYYEKESEMLSLYVMKSDGLSVPHDGQFQTSTTKAGLTTVSWAHENLAYVVVSDLPAEEVVKFASRS